jgi:hypothetical protein
MKFSQSAIRKKKGTGRYLPILIFTEQEYSFWTLFEEHRSTLETEVAPKGFKSHCKVAASEQFTPITKK